MQVNTNLQPILGYFLSSNLSLQNRDIPSFLENLQKAVSSIELLPCKVRRSSSRFSTVKAPPYFFVFMLNCITEDLREALNKGGSGANVSPAPLIHTLKEALHDARILLMYAESSFPEFMQTHQQHSKERGARKLSSSKNKPPKLSLKKHKET